MRSVWRGSALARIAVYLCGSSRPIVLLREGWLAKQQLLKQSRAWGLTNRRGCPLTSQAIGVLLRNQLYAGTVNVPEYGVRGKRGHFGPLISEELFYQAQAVLSRRLPSTAPRQPAHPDFPLRGFVRCESCGEG